MSEPPNAAIQGVLRSLLGSVAQQQVEAAAGFFDLPAVQDARKAAASGDFAGFKFSALYPIEKVIDGLLAGSLPQNEAAQFLLREQAFVERHFKQMIVQFEGASCCADKSYAILAKLSRFLVHGEHIVFDAGEKYTFHHPKVIFTTHEQIVEFFEALRELYYAHPERYIRVLTKLLGAKKGDVPQP